MSMGDVSRTERPILRGAGAKRDAGRGWVLAAIDSSPGKDGDSQEEVVDGDKSHGDARHGDHAFIARDAADGGEGNEPDGCSEEEEREERQGLDEAYGLGGADAGGDKGRAEIEAGE